MTVKDEIGDMIKALDSGVIAEPEPVTEEPKAKEPKVEELVKEPEPEPVKEPEAKVEPEPEVKAEEPTPEPVKVEEPKPDEKDQIIADLRTKLAEKEQPKVPEPKPEPKLEEQDFIGELDLDELTRDPKEFNKVLNKIYQKAVLDTRSGVMETLPDVVKTNIQIMNELKETSDRFYEENPDLRPFKKVVAVTFEEVAAANPTKNYTDLIKEVGPEVRKRLDLPKRTTESKSNNKKPEPPKLPQKGGRSGKAQEESKVNPLQSEIEEMNKTLNWR